MTLQISDDARVRTLTLDRPDALNAFNEALCAALVESLHAAADDPGVAVVLLTGNGRAFTAGADLKEMSERQATVPERPQARPRKHAFLELVEALADFPKPLLIAVNGVGLGLGMTILGFADLVFMSTTARLKCPFTDLGVAPEAASSYLLPLLVGRQNAAWALMSSEWIGAEEAVGMGLVWKVCEPEELMPVARSYAARLAAKPISSLVAVKSTMVAPLRAEIQAAHDRETRHFVELLGAPANAEALRAFTEGRAPDFTSLPPGT